MTISGCMISASEASTNSLHQSLLLYPVSIYDALALIYNDCFLRGCVADLWCIPLHVIDDIDQLGFLLIITCTLSVPHVFIWVPHVLHAVGL